MEKFQFRLLTYCLEAHTFLREVAPDVLTNVPWSGSLRNTFVSHTVPRHTYGTSRKPFSSHPWPYTHDTLAVSDRVDLCLLPQTSSLATCDSTFGGLTSGLGNLRSSPAFANIFLTMVYRKSLCEIFLPPHEE